MVDANYVIDIIAKVISLVSILGFIGYIIYKTIRIGKVKNGHFNVVFMLGNNRTKMVLLKPLAKQIKYKGKRLAFSDSRDYIFVNEHNIPTTIYDWTTGNQIPMKDLQRDKYDSTKVDNAVQISYDLGYKDGIDRVRTDNQILLIVLIGLVICILGVGYIAYNIKTMNTNVESMTNAVNGMKTAFNKFLNSNLPQVIN